MQRLRYLSLCIAALSLACGNSPNSPDSSGAPPLPDGAQLQMSKPGQAPSHILDFYNLSYTDLNLTFQFFQSVKNKTPEGKHPEWTWMSKFNVWDLIVTATAQDEEQFRWEIMFDGSGLDRWLMAAGTMNRDMRAGTLDMYEFNTNTNTVNVNWATDEEVLTLAVRVHGSLFNSRPSFRAEFKKQPNGQVDLVIREGDNQIDARWDASGAGSWTSYNWTTDQQTGSGTWGP